MTDERVQPKGVEPTRPASAGTATRGGGRKGRPMSHPMTARSRILLSVAALCAASPPASGEVSIVVQDCTRGVHLAVQQAPLSEVLQRLSEELGFELRFGTSEDPLVSANITAPPLELVQRLRAAQSVIVGVAPNPRCPNHARVTAVWVLGRGTGSAPMPPLKTGARIEAERRAREMNEMYLRAHGMDPALMDAD